MSLTVETSGASCGAAITGVQLNQPLSDDLVAEIRAHWLEHKVVAFPDQQLAPAQLVAFSEHFGEIGEDPFFGHIDEHPQVAAIQRNADETTSIFAEIFHSDYQKRHRRAPRCARRDNRWSANSTKQVRNMV